MSPEINLIDLATTVRQKNKTLPGWEIIPGIRANSTICRRDNDPYTPQIFLCFSAEDPSLLEKVTVMVWDNGSSLEAFNFAPNGEMEPSSSHRFNGSGRAALEPIAIATLTEFHQLIQQAS